MRDDYKAKPVTVPSGQHKLGLMAIQRTEYVTLYAADTPKTIGQLVDEAIIGTADINKITITFNEE